jgi:EpsI family protein
VPVYREGMLLQIPAGTYEVARACSGIKFLTAAVALGAYYAYINYRSLHKRLIFVAVSIVVAILSNGLRAYLLVLIGHLTDMTFRHDRWHIVLGYVVFGIILLLLFYVGGRYRDTSPAASPPAPAGAAAAPASGFEWRIAALGLLLMAGAPVLVRTLIDAGGSIDRIAAMSVPLTPAQGWAAAEEAAIEWRPHIGGGANRVEGSYRRDSALVDVFIEVYPVPSRDDAEMVSYRNSIQADANERLYTDRAIDPHLPAIAGLRVRETEIPGSPPRLVWYWYDVAGHSTVSPTRVKLAELRSVLTQGRAAQRVIVLSTPAESHAAARDRLREFLAAHGSQLVVPGP